MALLVLRSLLGLSRSLLDDASRLIALVASGVSLACALAAWRLFDAGPGAEKVQLVQHLIWIRSFNVEYFVGVDGLSISMVLLSGLISFVATIASMPWWSGARAARLAGMLPPEPGSEQGGHAHPVHFSVKAVPGYMALLLLLQTGMMGTFVSLDMFLFYVFWEVMLLPMYFLIGIWGGPRKEYAAIKFFLYTLAGSVLMLLAIIGIYYNSAPAQLADGQLSAAHTFNLIELARQGAAGQFANAAPILGMEFTKVAFVALFIGFAIKIPMFPFHTWLPDAHVEAPTPISVILAGVLLKMGPYGILRFNYPLLRDATQWAAGAIAVFGVINIVYAALVCLAQKDLKRLIAYSSISHMGFTLLGMAAMTPAGISGAVLNMFTHGLISAHALLGGRRDLRSGPSPRDRAVRRPGPGAARVLRRGRLRLLRLPGVAGARRVHLRVHGLLGRLPGLHHLHHGGRHQRRAHRRLLPVGHPPDVPRQAQPRLPGIPRPQLAGADSRSTRWARSSSPWASTRRPSSASSTPPSTRSSLGCGRCSPKNARQATMDPLPLALENLTSLAYFRPEMALTLGTLVLLVLDAAWRNTRGRVVRLACAALLVFLLSGLLLLAQPAGKSTLFNGMIASDGFATFFKWLFLAAGAMTVLTASLGRDLAPERLGEFFALLVAVVLGLFLMASATDLLMMYLAIELVSMTSYVLAGFKKGDRRATEAALKYVIYGGVASGVMLFGMCYLYGLTGTISFSEPSPPSPAPWDSGATLAGAKLATVAGVAFMLAGIGYKIAAVPFHMWCPDVYEGAPTPFTAFLSVGPKAAGFALALRFFLSAFGLLGSQGTVLLSVPWPAVIGVVAAVTMTYGNLVAISQTNLKRLLAYSSIAHAGYMLMGVCAATIAGAQSVMIYLAIYLVMNLGAFIVVMLVAGATGSESILDYRGLSRRLPLTAVAFVVFLLSLTGIPPFAGFVGKWYLFTAVFARIDGAGGAWYAALLLVAALNTAISLYYYARIIRAMFLDAPNAAEPKLLKPAFGYQLLAGLLAALVIVVGVVPQPVISWTEHALEMLGMS